MEEKPKKRRQMKKAVSINLDNTTYPSIKRNSKRLGWKITESTDNNLIFWCDNNVGIEFCLSMHQWQFVNHFPGTYCISRKIDLYMTLKRLEEYFPKEISFHPISFALPTQQRDLSQHIANSIKARKTFIIKPDLGAQGRGIYLIQDAESALQCTELAIAQQYLPPLLLDGLKFDFRIYVLLTSINPIRVYTYREGMARLCTEPYVKPRKNNLDQIYRHLTNYSLNKKNDHFQKNANAEDNDSGHKRSLSSVFKELASKQVDVEKIQNEIDDIIRFTIIAAQPFLNHSYKSCFKHVDSKSRCFEIMGFDIMIDKKLKPWLLEVNHSPSLTCDSPFDKELKDGVISGAMKIINIDPNFKAKISAIEKQQTMNRINGLSSGKIPTYAQDDAKESEIALETGWRQLLPCEDMYKYDVVLDGAKLIPIGGLNETAASKARRESVNATLPKKETETKPVIIRKPIVRSVSPIQKRPLTIVPKVPKSFRLRQEANIQKMQSTVMREQSFTAFEPDRESRHVEVELKKPQIARKMLCLDL